MKRNIRKIHVDSPTSFLGEEGRGEGGRRVSIMSSWYAERGGVGNSEIDRCRSPLEGGGETGGSFLGLG